MPEPRFGHAVCASDSLIYITGGIILNSEGGHEITDRIDAIEVGTGEFHTLGRMNTPRVYHEACFLGDTLYMLGGQSSLYQPEVLRSVEVYSGDDQESAETSLMNTPRMQFGACAVKGRVYAFGGRTSLTGEGSVTKKTEVYTPESGEWVYKADMPEARYGFSVAAYQDDVYVVGGTDQTESPSGQSDKVFVFHP
ncbi:MAG: Kelch repeat-containing protein [Chitinivibrionales bacterium]